MFHGLDSQRDSGTENDGTSSANIAHPSSPTNDDSSDDSDEENAMKILNLAQKLVYLLHFEHCSHELRIASAQLLFDMHMRESILFSNVVQSYIVTGPSIHIAEDLAKLGSLSDDKKLLVKMHKGELGDLTQSLLEKLDELASLCLLEDDPTEPHKSYQEIIYTTRKEHPVSILCMLIHVYMVVCTCVCSMHKHVHY